MKIGMLAYVLRHTWIDVCMYVYVYVYVGVGVGVGVGVVG